MSTVDDIARQILTPLLGGPEDITAFAEALSLVAWKQGFVLTVETRAEAPLAMGNYGLDVHVRPRRDVLCAEVGDAAAVRRRWSTAGRGAE